MATSVLCVASDVDVSIVAHQLIWKPLISICHVLNLHILEQVVVISTQYLTKYKLKFLKTLSKSCCLHLLAVLICPWERDTNISSRLVKLGTDKALSITLLFHPMSSGTHLATKKIIFSNTIIFVKIQIKCIVGVVAKNNNCVANYVLVKIM